MFTWLCMLFLVLLIGCSDEYKILAVFPFPSPSHGILGDAHVRLLLNAGHEVTYITPFPGKHSHKNYTEIDISKEDLEFPGNLFNLRTVLENGRVEENFRIFGEFLTNVTTATLDNKNVLKFIKEPDNRGKFDVIIIEWMISEIYTGLSVVFDCPFIWFITYEPASSQLRLIDESVNPAYSADPLGEAVPPLDFKQRLIELWKQFLYIFVFMDIIYTPMETKMYEDTFGPIIRKSGRILPSFDEVRLNASLMLGNSYVAMGEPLRLPQNFKPIAGYHIDPQVKLLPKDLKKVMDEAKDGAIYFSLGSNIKSKDIPQDLKKKILTMFSTLKYTVIWKFEDILSDLPKNVHILQWAPQQSILAHPNCKLFITHGGLLSITEALHYNVPLIGIPLFGDQFTNVIRSVKRGHAKMLKFSYTIAEDLETSIREIFADPSYAENTKMLSMIYHDRVVPPGAELVHWVEHVVRTRGAPHLRSPALLVPLYQKLYLDLAALLLAAALLLRVALKSLIRLVWIKDDSLIGKKRK